MSVTYDVALPFVRTDEGIAPGQAQEMPNEPAAVRRAELMSRDPGNSGALAFKRTGDPNMGNFGDATVLRTFGQVPETSTSFESALLALFTMGYDLADMRGNLLSVLLYLGSSQTTKSMAIY